MDWIDVGNAVEATGKVAEASEYRNQDLSGKPPKMKVPWSPAHYLGLAVAVFAAVCIVYAALVALGVLS